jgi:hypothetical protein
MSINIQVTGPSGATFCNMEEQVRRKDLGSGGMWADASRDCCEDWVANGQLVLFTEICADAGSRC